MVLWRNQVFFIIWRICRGRISRRLRDEPRKRPRERPRAFQPKIAAVSDREGDRLEVENSRGERKGEWSGERSRWTINDLDVQINKKTCESSEKVQGIFLLENWRKCHEKRKEEERNRAGHAPCCASLLRKPFEHAFGNRCDHRRWIYVDQSRKRCILQGHRWELYKNIIIANNAGCIWTSMVRNCAVIQ